MAKLCKNRHFIDENFDWCSHALHSHWHILLHLAAEKFDSDFWCGGEKRGDESRDEEQDYGTLHCRNRKAEGVLEAS